MIARSALRALGVVLIVAGAVLLGLAILNGDVTVALIVIIPVIYGVGPLAVLAVLMLFAGITTLLLSAASLEREEDGSNAEEVSDDRPSTKREFGGVILIGPIPIVFGSARALRGTWALAVVAALSLIVLLLFLFILLR
jgi:uncharacterized protein (TIGR00304 family)